jgi:prepilin-type N-terminal cleavage/methylation domain-containing protein
MKKRKDRGMSIVELLVAVALLGIVLLMGLYLGKGQVQRADFTSSINQFIADLNYARQLASRENRYVAIDFNDNGSGYTILVQRAVGIDLSNPDSYSINKTVEPMNGEQFISGATDFAVNSMGIIRAYPVAINSNPITVTFDIFKRDPNSRDIVYQKRLTIFPTGGVKVETKRDQQLLY